MAAGKRAAVGQRAIETFAEELLSFEIHSLSQQYTDLFERYNRKFFAGSLHAHTVRVVFDVDRSAQQPEVDLMTRSAFTDSARHFIYLRYSESWPMKGGLLHEMAHLAVGDDEMQCPKELRRLKALGAPIPAWELRGTSV